MIQFSDIFGQDAAIDVIRRAYRSDRLPHGLIFAGPVGVGKATTARALAGLFLCERPQDSEACGTCSACTLMAAGSHPDYHVITKELIRYHDRTGKSKGIDLSINVVRPELVEPAGRKSAMGVGKVFAIEQAELMNAQAQNAILKTLEEPAGRTIIILLTDQPGLLLPTIRSRCQIVRFASLDPATVERELKAREIDAATASQAAELAEGSLGVALKWIEDGVVEAAGELTGRLEDVLSGQPASDLQDWFKKSAETYAGKQLARDPLGSKDQATREGLGLYLRLAANFFRRRLRETENPDAMERACSAIDAIARAEENLDANVNVALTFQQLGVALERHASPLP